MAASASCRLSAGASRLNVYCSRGVQPARFDVLKANAYIDHDFGRHCLQTMAVSNRECTHTNPIKTLGALWESPKR